MKPAVSMWSFEAEIKNRDWSQSDFINWAADHSIRNVELISYYMDKENNADEIRSLLDSFNMQVSCYTILNDFTDPSNDGLSIFMKDLDTASILGAPFIRTLTGDGSLNDSDGRNKLIKRFKQASSAAKKRNITLVIENIGPHSGHSKEAVSIIEDVDSPSLRLNFDTANPLLADEDPIDALKTMLPYVAYVHLKDFITEKSEDYSKYSDAEWRIQTSRKGLKMTGITPGKGEIELSKMFEILKQNNYTGFISAEYENDLDVETSVEDSIAIIKTASPGSFSL